MNATAATAERHRVLVVDDEPNIVDVITMALRFQGFQVQSAGTGRDAPVTIAVLMPATLRRGARAGHRQLVVGPTVARR